MIAARKHTVIITNNNLDRAFHNNILASVFAHENNEVVVKWKKNQK